MFIKTKIFTYTHFVHAVCVYDSTKRENSADNGSDIGFVFYKNQKADYFACCDESCSAKILILRS